MILEFVRSWRAFNSSLYFYRERKSDWTYCWVERTFFSWFQNSFSIA